MALAAKGANVGSVFIDVKANADNFRAGMERAKTEAQRAGTAMSGAMAKTDAAARGLHGSLTNLHTILGLIGGVALAHSLIEISDKFSLMRSRIRLVTQAGEDMYAIEEKLAEQAMRNRADLKSTIDLYTRLRQSRKDLSDEVTRDLVDKWSKSLIISASSAQEAASSTQQFSQAMAAGVLAGQELRSVIQGNSAFATYLAEGLGVTTGALKAMGEEGKLTLDVILKAMANAGHTIEHDFAKKALTVHQALINVDTALTRFVGLADQGAGASNQLAKWINLVAENFDTLARVIGAVAVSLGTAFATGAVMNLVGALGKLVVAMRAAASAGKALQLVMNFMGGPWGIALGAAVAGLQALTATMDDTRTAAQKAADAAKGVADQIKRTDEIIAAANLDAATKALEGMGTEADKTAAKFALLAEEMKKTGAAQKQLAIDQQWEKNFQLINAIADLEKDMANPMQTVFVERGMSFEAPKFSPAQMAAKRKEIDDMKALLAEGQKREREILGTKSDLFKPGELTAPATAAPTVTATAKAVQELTGYYTDLEQLERNLADIRKAEGEGATGASRAAVQAMLDYLDATGDVSTVLQKVADLQGDILSDADKSLIAGFATAADLTKRMNASGNQALDLTGVNQIDGPPPVSADFDTAWDGFEQGIADATKRGLINAIETGDWGDAFGDILTDVTRDALSRALDVLWDALSQIDWGGGGTGWGGFFNMVGSSFGMSPAGGRASGGPVSAGRMYRVGEMGSEWFVPKTDGFIMPNGAVPARELGQKGSITVGGAVINIQGDASAATARMIAESLDKFGRSLPTLIDMRVQDRIQRGAY